MSNWIVELVEHIGQSIGLVFLSLTVSVRCRRLSYFSLCWKPYFHFFFFFLWLSFATMSTFHYYKYCDFFIFSLSASALWMCVYWSFLILFHARGLISSYIPFFFLYFCYSYSVREICLGLNNFLFITTFFFFFLL